MKSKAIIFEAPMKVSVGEIDLPEPGPGEVLTRTLVTGVSTGTETRVLVGKQNGAVFPLIPGYENVGEVVQVGKGIASLKPGDRVFHAGSVCTGDYFRCWGAQVEYALATPNSVFPVPETVSSQNAIYAKTGAIAYHGIQRTALKAGETVAVVGQGLIGHLAAQVAKAQGAKVIVIDPIPARLEAALAAGVDHALNPNEVDVGTAVKDLTGNRLDVAVDVTGLAHTLKTTLHLLPVKPWDGSYHPSPRLLILGSYTDPVCFDYEEDLFGIEPDILISRDVVNQDLVDVLALMAAQRINPEHIPATRLPYVEAEKGYAALLNRETMRVIYQWSEV